jgi:hypothetical protein
LAVFNPEIQRTNDPQYGSNSRAVDTPDGIRPQGVQQNQIMPEGQKIGDRSAEYEGQAKAFEAQGQAAGNKAFGDLFANIVGIADYLGKGGVQLVKKDIENKVYEVASAERSAYTAELEKIKATVGVKNIISDAPTSESGEAVPEAVTELGATLATLKSARDGGKITKTDYWGRLAQAAQDIRSQYPGFKAEIDAEFQKVTGQNPANARINGLVTEINRAAAAASSGQNKTLTLIKQNLNIPGAEKLHDDFIAGRIDESAVVAKISGYQQKVEELKMNKAQAENKNLSIEERQLKMGAVVDKAVGMAVANEAERLAVKYGFDTPQNAEQLANAQKAGAISSQRWEEANLEVQQSITRLEMQAARDVVRTGASGALKGGQKEANERIQANLEQLRSLQKAIVDKDVGTMYSAKRESTSIMDDARKDLYKDSVAGPTFVGLKLIAETGAEQYIQKMMAEQAFGKDGASDVYKDWQNRWRTALMTQNKSKPDGTPLVYNDFIQEMKLKKVDDPIQQARITKTMVNEVSKIAQSDVPDNLKVGLVKAAFSDRNNGFLSKLNMDTFDERGRPVSGMNAVFQKWTAPEVTNEVKRLSKSDPQLWNQYTDWVKASFGRELVPRELADLSKFQKDPNIKIEWSVENQRFDVSRTAMPQLQANRREGLGGEGMSHSERAADIQQFQTVQRSINRINNGMANMKHIASLDNPTDKTASSAFLLRALVEGSSPEVIRNLNSLPADLVNKILLGNANANRKR